MYDYIAIVNWRTVNIYGVKAVLFLIWPWVTVIGVWLHSSDYVLCKWIRPLLIRLFQSQMHFDFCVTLVTLWFSTCLPTKQNTELKVPGLISIFDIEYLKLCIQYLICLWQTLCFLVTVLCFALSCALNCRICSDLYNTVLILSAMLLLQQVENKIGWVYGWENTMLFKNLFKFGRSVDWLPFVLLWITYTSVRW